MGRTIEELLMQARARIHRVTPAELDEWIAGGRALVVDIRPQVNRDSEGELPGAVSVERTVFEWRLDPASPHRIPEVRDHDQPVIVVCNEGYASSLAAAALVDLGYTWVADLDGGYREWAASRGSDDVLLRTGGDGDGEGAGSGAQVHDRVAVGDDVEQER